MDKVSRSNFDAYESDARSWETGTNLALKKSARIAWMIAFAGVTVGVLGIGAATVQALQEPPMPTVLRVDNTTGIVDRVTSLAEGKIATSEATDKYFAQLYVRYCDGWDQYVAKENYYRCGLMSTPAQQQKYEQSYRRSALSPMKVYGELAKVRIDIKGTSFIQPGVASVRYVRVVERGNVSEATHHTATVTFAYSSGRMSEKDRAINPLGFQAEYRTDPDAPGIEPTVSAPMSAQVQRQVLPQVQIQAQGHAPLDFQPLQAGGK